MDNKCPQCGKDMEVNYTPTFAPGKYQKRSECKEHGRIFSFVEEAVAERENPKLEQFYTKSNLLKCMACGRIGVDKLFATKDGDLVCEGCKDKGVSRMEIEAMQQHMREICAE